MSKHGCAEKAALLIGESLSDREVDIVDLKRKMDVDLSRYDTVIVGGSIYLGSLQRGIRNFCSRNLAMLLEKRVGLFICCMNEGGAARAHYDAVFDGALRAHATAAGIFGGELDFGKLSLLEKSVIGQAVNITESCSRFDEKAVGEFTAKF